MMKTMQFSAVILALTICLASVAPSVLSISLRSSTNPIPVSNLDISEADFPKAGKDKKQPQYRNFKEELPTFVDQTKMLPPGLPLTPVPEPIQMPPPPPPALPRSRSPLDMFSGTVVMLLFVASSFYSVSYYVARAPCSRHFLLTTTTHFTHVPVSRNTIFLAFQTVMGKYPYTASPFARYGTYPSG